MKRNSTRPGAATALVMSLWVAWAAGSPTAGQDTAPPPAQTAAPAIPPSSASQGPGPAAEPFPGAREAALSRTVRLEVDAPSLDPALSRALPVLVETALEARDAMEVIPPQREERNGAPAAAGWVLRLSVSGKGPWKMSVRVSPAEDHPDTSKAFRFTASRVSFSDLERLVAAVDATAMDLHRRWREAGVVPQQTAPAPLAQALSPSPRAIARYVEATHALRGQAAAEAGRLLDEVLKEHPRCGLASLQKAWLDRSRQTAIVPCASAEEARLGTQRLCYGISLLASGDLPRALQVGERLRAEAQHLAWGHVMSGLSLAAAGRSREALAGWRQIAAQDPDDPRARLWLGVSAMAAGEFAEAAPALAAARAAWPDLWIAYTLEAECHARLGKTKPAKAVAEEMKRQMEARRAVPASGAESPDLLLGSLALMEGRFGEAIRIFDPALEALLGAGAPPAATRTIHETIVEMRRDQVTTRDPILRDRQFQEADEALARFETSLSGPDREAHACPLLRLRGLMQVRRGQTADAWRTVEKIREHQERPGYTPYEEAYLSAAIMLKEGDNEGALSQFKRAAQVRGRLVDVIEVSQIETRMKRFDDARASFEIIDERLSRYEAGGESRGELILTDPHLALLVPLYHFTRAQHGYFTGNRADSRRHYELMLKYFKTPDDMFAPYVKEALDRGARAE